MGYDQLQYTVPDTVAVEPRYFCCFPLALANIRPQPLLPFFQISLNNSQVKTTHNTFRDCRVHFFRQPFSKQLSVYFENTTTMNIDRAPPLRFKRPQQQAALPADACTLSGYLHLLYPFRRLLRRLALWSVNVFSHEAFIG